MISKHIHFITLFTLLSLFLFSCKEKKQDRHIVTVSILPQKYFVERIAGDYLQVNVMVPPGMNPATCDLNTGQLKKLYDSDLCFAIGYLPFETTHLYPALSNRPDIPLIRHSDSLQLIAGSCNHDHHDHTHEGGVDPHVWLSPHYAKSIGRDIYRTLSEKYPEKQQEFLANYKLLEQDIDKIAHSADSILSEKKHKTFLIYHPALTYFAHDYNMEQISIEHEGKEPDPRHLKEIMDTAKEKDIHVIFIQNQFDISNAQSIAKAIGTDIIPIDPLNEDWLAEMQKLLQIFQEKLN